MLRKLRQISLNGKWRYRPQAYVTVLPDGRLDESLENLPASGEMLIPLDGVLERAPTLFWSASDKVKAGLYQLELQLLSASGEVLSKNTYPIELKAHLLMS